MGGEVFFIIFMPTLPQSSYKTTTWKGGVTRQIFISPADGDLSVRQFDVRISSAIIDDVQSDFSDFSGFTRYILPLEGEITLIKGGRYVTLSHNALYEFEGDEEVSSENTQGAVDFNIIVRHGISVEVGIMEDTAFTDSRQTIVFALEDCCIEGKTVRKHDTALLDEPFSLKGKAVIVRFM